MKPPYIKIPIKILTPKIAENKQNSFFYAGQNIAEVKVCNRTYVLTTAGEYSFSLKEGEGTISFDSCDMARAWIQGKLPGPRPPQNLTDAKIKKLDDNGCVNNWGWFGINVWEYNNEVGPTDTYSQYDEALTAFITFIEKDINHGL